MPILLGRYRTSGQAVAVVVGERVFAVEFVLLCDGQFGAERLRAVVGVQLMAPKSS